MGSFKRLTFTFMDKRQKSIIEEDILLCDKEIFGDDMEHSYNIECFDGHAIATLNEDPSDNIPEELSLTYPLKKDVVADNSKAQEVLTYRGLYDLSSKDITFGDIMMKYGTIPPPKKMNQVLIC